MHSVRSNYKECIPSYLLFYVLTKIGSTFKTDKTDTLKANGVVKALMLLIIFRKG